MTLLTSDRIAHLFCSISVAQLEGARKVFRVAPGTHHAGPSVWPYQDALSNTRLPAYFASCSWTEMNRFTGSLLGLFAYVGPFLRRSVVRSAGLLCPKRPGSLNRVDATELPAGQCGRVQYGFEVGLARRVRSALSAKWSRSGSPSFVRAGANNDEIALFVNCARATISTYWNRIFKKVGVGSIKQVLLRLLDGQASLKVAALDPGRSVTIRVSN
jgi:hypothetical protein